MAGARRQALAAAVAVVVWLCSTAAASLAHDARCAAALREAPIEAMTMPPGWGLVELELDPSGWTGTAQWLGGDIRGAAFSVACVDDAPDLMRRRAAIRAAFRVEDAAVEPVVGDAAVVWRRPVQGPQTVEWRSGDVFGVVTGEWNAGVEELAALAAALVSAIDP